MNRLFFALLLLCCVASARAEVRVLTSIKPVQLIAAAVQEGVGQPALLLPPGASPHYHSLRPSDLRRLQEATLFYWIGPDLEGFLGKPLATRSGPSLALQSLPGLQLRHFADAAGESGHDPHDHAHRPGSLDAHLWLLPANARMIAARMAADLALADPLNAARYQRNLAAFSVRLDSLDQQLGARLAGLKGKPYFVFHETYDYFEQAYGLQHAGVFGIQSEVQPGARHVAELREQLQRAGPSCVFSEPPLQPRLAQTLSAGLPVHLAELDAMGSAVAVDARGYERLLENLAATLGDCLQQL
ncbi:zinc ABC transporter substrate-binding protein [Pseudomonas sp. N040]|uniref:zinc ABC transporter substrate-binding protein n=1 Tax=Pseudomonas sp. N040 TaxID=2785325 RepID=UPI0018A2ECD3|nr:zinc ABC transporter substrate-binding protein [Pseudomonas sp. N040]MBF7728820.1 zinc ABC transporter substrate-binding protein [Pseudomonas sp. N040]MBW7012460.1 zinc ABC transporter substrate-binding protein [Pseudomonas sp. N040]